MIAILDCGTTNTKCYIVDEKGGLIAEGYSEFGVKDNTQRGDREDYKRALQKVVMGTLSEAGRRESELKKVVAFGMISSDLGLVVVPHLTVPVGLQEIRKGVYRVRDESIFGKDTAFYLIRGIKNKLPSERSLDNIYHCDFMRGEETQVMGILERYKPGEAFNVIMFGSHVKIIHVSADGKILQSMTTMSGQIYDCLARYTVVGKSIETQGDETKTLTDDELISMAVKTIDARGTMRAFLLPRFMESFTDMNALERRVYLNAVIAVEDLKAIREYYGKGIYATKQYYFIGQKERCQLFEKALRQEQSDVEVEILDGREKNRDISIIAVLKIMKEYEEEQDEL